MLATSFGIASASRASAAVTTVPAAQGTAFRNPILPTIPGSTRRVETFADPAIIKAKDGYYYAYGTKDPRFDGDTFHVIPIVRSNDLVNWTYVGDAFPNGNPPSAEPFAGIFAPDIRYMNDQYYLYYSITNVAGTTTNEFGTPGGDDSAIGVATSLNPAGPFTDRGIVVEPTTNPCCPPGPDNPSFFRATIDPAVLPLPDGRRLIYYGSYNGGLDVRQLTPDGLRSLPATQRRVAIDNRYEGPFVIYRNGFYYMFVSATDCCNFELTGYDVFAGRSRSPFGPFVDREGDTFIEPRVGGEIADLADHSERYRLRFGGYGSWEDGRAEHRRIVDAAAAGDPDLAAVRLAEHYARTAVLVFGVLKPEHDLGRLRTTISAVAPGAEAALGTG